MTDAAERLHEQLLVLRCQAGDEAAFAELVARYHPRLRYYLRRMLPRADQADDGLQEVWLAVYRALPRLAEPAALAAWLYRIARDKASVQWRTRPPETPLADADPAEETSDDTEFRREDAQEIHACLAQLAPEQREVLVLRFMEDMSYQQIAEVTGCPLGTVRSRLHYAKSALRQAIEQRRSNEGDRHE
jgi:RNA polymerase sigma-70 factor, ECF subfamily